MTVTRIAMWSGPRNISTAMMRSWGSRADAVVCDEPLYACYLAETGDRRHPGFDEIVQSLPAAWREVAAWLTGPLPEGKSVFYQKLMAHHLLPGFGREWIDRLTSAFLIREPRGMIASLAKVLDRPTAPDTGLPQQVEIFRRERDLAGAPPVVVDAQDLLADPPAMLPKLCAGLGVEFDEAMLSWAPGLRETDGVWARHWYGRVAETTGFEPYADKPAELPPELEPLLEECLPLYQELHAHRLT